MAVEFTIGVQRESKKDDPNCFENSDTTCGLLALPILALLILVSLTSESRMVTVSGTL